MQGAVTNHHPTPRIRSEYESCRGGCGAVVLARMMVGVEVLWVIRGWVGGDTRLCLVRCYIFCYTVNHWLGTTDGCGWLDRQQREIRGGVT